MILKKITYNGTIYGNKTHEPDNAQAVFKFIGKVPECSLCGGTGEYEGEYGPISCGGCCSRLIVFIDHKGNRNWIDWGQSVELHHDGMYLIDGESQND